MTKKGLTASGIKEEYCCPLCEGEITHEMYLFVRYVTSTKNSVEDYFSGKLTFESWKNDTLNALGVEQK